MKTKIRVLIVEDSEDDALLMIYELRHGGYEPQFERVETAEAMKNALAAHPWDVILSDYKMPHFSALAALSMLKDSGLDIPFIIISGAIGEDLAVECMKAGAHDYIMKDSLARLTPAIQREMREAKERQDRRKMEKALWESETRLRAVVDNFIDGIITIDKDGIVESFNPAAARIFGYKSAEIIGKSVNLLIPKSFGDKYDGYIQKTMGSRCEVVGTRKDGASFPLDFGISAMFLGEHPKYICIVRDLSSRKKDEAKA